MKPSNWAGRVLLITAINVISGFAAADEKSNDQAAASGLKFEFLETVSQTRPDGVKVQIGASYVYTSDVHEVSLKLIDQTPSELWQPGDPSWEIPKQRGTPEIINPRPVNPVKDPVDPLLAKQQTHSTRAPSGFSVPVHNFNALRSGANPNDPSSDVGLNWFVVGINGTGGSQYMFYDKANPAVTNGPYTLDAMGTGLCANGYGDPIIFYDEIAQRWIFTEFSTSGNRMCVYVAKTSDPLVGGFWAYNFQTPNFPDYPKYAVWGDAYLVGTNEAKSKLYALDRAAMLAGTQPMLQGFEINDPGAFAFAMIPPVDVDGQTQPPNGSPAIFIRHYDDEAHSPGSNNPSEDYLEIFEYDPDFATPANSTLTGPIRIAIAEFDSELCGYTAFACFPQLGSSTRLDPLREVVMNLPKYRNFNGQEVIVGNFVTDVNGSDHGGIRWFELRKLVSGDWFLHQEGTWAPDLHHRFMGTSALDVNANIALGYSISSSSLHPGVRYTGHAEGSTPGVLSEPETTLASGSAPSDGNRWGDYASMSVDPVDGCTFWMVENYAISGGARRQNRVGAFRFDGCNDPSYLFVGTNLNQRVCALDSNLANVGLNVTALLGFNNPVDLAFSNLPAGISGNITPAQLTGGGDSTVDFTINPGTVNPGLNEIVIEATADNEAMTATIVRQTTLSAIIETATPGIPALLSPANAAVNQVTAPAFSWTESSQSGGFILEIASDAGFTNIVYSAATSGTTHQITSELNFLSTYFWRVRATNECGTGLNSPVYSFTTVAPPVSVCATPGQTIPDNNPTGINSDIVLDLPGQNIIDLNVSIDISHSYTGDLQIVLQNVDSASSTLVFSQHCGDGDNIDVVLDDASTASLNVCSGTPPAVSGVKLPFQPLDVFNGLPSSGTWRLKVSDHGPADIGTLNEWCILHTSAGPAPNDTVFEHGFENNP